MKDKNLFSPGNRFFDSICHIPTFPKKSTKKDLRRGLFTQIWLKKLQRSCAQSSQLMDLRLFSALQNDVSSDRLFRISRLFIITHSFFSKISCIISQSCCSYAANNFLHTSAHFWNISFSCVLLIFSLPLRRNKNEYITQIHTFHSHPFLSSCWYFCHFFCNSSAGISAI